MLLLFWPDKESLPVSESVYYDQYTGGNNPEYQAQYQDTAVRYTSVMPEGQNVEYRHTEPD